MAKKKQEIQLQREIETQEEWEEVMAMEGLWVVDVYQEWCGPCTALVGNFRRLKNELGDPLLNFAIAKADTIDALEKYRGRCEPTFLFFAGGILVSFIHGANSPKVQRVITEQLAQEHKVLEGQTERKEVKDPVITRNQERELQRQEAEEAAREAEGLPPRSAGSPRPEPKGYTVAIIKPEAVAAGKVEAIVQELGEKGIEVIAEQGRELTEDEAREIYSEHEGQDFYEDLIKFMTSGPSHMLLLTKGETGETIIKDYRELLGPTNVEQAQEEAPDCLRAKYGEKGYMNALHGSSTKDQAAKELAFFFPNLPVPTYMKKKENIQRTLALIRPEALVSKKDEILQKIEEAGFTIALHKEVQLTKDQAAEFYKEHEGNAYYDELISLMSSGPLLALGLARDEAVDAWRGMLGPNNVDEAQEQSPNSLRATYVGESGLNQFHGSDSMEAAKKELHYFFPMQETMAVIKPAAMGTKDAIIDRIHEAGFRIAAHKETTITKDIADIMYPNQQDKDYYEDLVNSITSGPTYFMVLTRENAVEGWRGMVGDTDPEQAKTNNPESLRATFGTDILNNAVHGSSNVERAREEMKAIFGDLEFNEDGTIKGQQPDLDEATLVTETTMETTTMDQDTTQAPSADVTADETQMNETQADTTVADTTVADTTMEDTTMTDTTMDTTTMDTTTADTTTADTGGATTKPEPSPIAEETEDPSADQTADQTTSGETTADATTADTTTVEGTTADTTAASPTGDPTPPSPTKEGEETHKQGEDTQQGEATQQERAESPPKEAEAASEQVAESPKQEESQPVEETPASDSAGGEEQQQAAEPTSEQADQAPSAQEEAKGAEVKEGSASPEQKDETTAQSEAPATDAPTGDAPPTEPASGEQGQDKPVEEQQEQQAAA